LKDDQSICLNIVREKYINAIVIYVIFPANTEFLQILSATLLKLHMLLFLMTHLNLKYKDVQTTNGHIIQNF